MQSIGVKTISIVAAFASNAAVVHGLRVGGDVELGNLSQPYQQQEPALREVNQVLMKY